jgi:hypothetical protein
VLVPPLLSAREYARFVCANACSVAPSRWHRGQRTRASLW